MRCVNLVKVFLCTPLGFHSPSLPLFLRPAPFFSYGEGEITMKKSWGYISFANAVSQVSHGHRAIVAVRRRSPPSQSIVAVRRRSPPSQPSAPALPVQAWAMYSLVMFYYAFKEDLKPIKPLGKFLSIKMIIFATFWQAVVVSILVEANAIPVRAAEPASMFGTLPRRRGASLHFFFFCFWISI